jgi:type VI secretion system protein ImpA
MPSPATIDIDALVQPIPGDDPAGRPLSGTTVEKLKQLREEFDPSELDADDPNRNEPRKDANWQGIIDLGEETLKDGSKSLVIAVRLVEALTMKHGMVGVRDGFRLLRRLSEECWDRMYPKVEDPDEDLEARARPFETLDDDKSGMLYPSKLRDVPLLVSGSTRVSVIAWRGAGRQKPTITMEQIGDLARTVDPARRQNMIDDLNETIDEVNRLGKVLEVHLTSFAPSFHRVREALDECRTLAQGMTAQRNGPSAAGGELAVEQGGGAGAAPMLITGATTREGVYKQIEMAADALARVDPHSPVPHLIRRAVQLKDLTFPELVDQLTKDANVLAFLKRDIAAEESSSG